METVTDIALGTRQRCHQLRVTTRNHPPGPLLIGRQPPQYTLLESGETPRRHHCAPATSRARCVSAGAEKACVSPASRAAWPGASRRSERRLRGRWPVRTICTAAWTAIRSKSVRWMIQGACDTTWRAGKVPWVINRLMTVALTPHCCAAWLSVTQSVPFGTFGRRY